MRQYRNGKKDRILAVLLNGQFRIISTGWTSDIVSAACYLSMFVNWLEYYTVSEMALCLLCKHNG